jgi:predicted Zn-dependent protease
MTAKMITQSELARNVGQAYQQALQLTLQQAVNCHEANRLDDAERSYRSILDAQPEHPEANHNLGVLLLERQQFEASLPHFEAALAARPESQGYWLSYIDALVLAGQTELAQRTLAFGREHGMSGDSVDALVRLLGTAPQLEVSVDVKPAAKKKTVKRNTVKKQALSV